MKKRYVLSAVVCLAVILCAGLAAGALSAGRSSDTSEPSQQLACWADGESRAAFLSYVAAVTDAGSPDLIPEEDRLAVFDLDGTLCGEQFPTYIEWMLYVHRVLDDAD